MQKKEQKSFELLKEIVNWWDEWNNSKNPTAMENPPIEEARKLLMELKNHS